MKKYLVGFFAFTMVVGLSIFSLSCGDSSSGGGCQDAIDSGIAADIITKCDPAKVIKAQEALDAGLSLIVSNSPTEAKTLLSAVPSTDPLYGQAQYGIMINDLQLLVKDVDSLIGMVMSLTSMTSIEPQASGVDLWSMLGSMIDPIKAKLLLLDTEAAAVIENGYTLETKDAGFTKVPLILGTSGGQYYITVDVKGKAGAVEARALKVVANIVIGVIEFIAAHDLTIDLTSAMSNLSGLMDMLEGITGGGGGDLTKSLRGLGWLLADNPTFLKMSSTRWSTNMGAVPGRFTTAIDALRELDADIIATAQPTAAACKVNVACLISPSMNGAINEGDKLLINAKVNVEIKYTLTADLVETIDSLKSAVLAMFGITLNATTVGITVTDFDLTNDVLLGLTPMLMDPIGRIIPTLDALLIKVKDSINSGAVITTADINPLIEALDPDSSLPKIPEGLLTITVKNLYDKPLRNLMTYFACDKTTTLPATASTLAKDKGSCLAIETESLDCTGSTGCSLGDTTHFEAMTGTIVSIKADGAAPKACASIYGNSGNKPAFIPTKNTIYVALGDASINGVLSINLSALPDPYKEAAAVLEPATNYSLWKCVNYVITDWAGQAELATISKDVRGVGDVIMNAVPAGTIPDFLNCGAFPE